MYPHVGADFQLVEATLHDYKDKNSVKVVCKYDGKWLHLCPRGSNLQTILTQHINAKSHINAWSKKTTIKQSSSLFTGASGRPKKNFEKDPCQQTLGAFLVSTKEHAEVASIHAGDSSSHLLNLCWGLWQCKLDVNGSEVDIKPFLQDLKMGEEWFCEPHTKATLYDGDVEYRIDGCFRHVCCLRISRIGILSTSTNRL